MLPTKFGFKLNPYLCALLPLAMHSVAFAQGLPTSLPTGGQVVSGSAVITTGTDFNDTDFVHVAQGSSNVLINWSTFDIANGNIVQFDQPDTSSVAVNRVLSPNASFLNGALNSNGRVFVINPNGILFGAGSSVNVGGLLATTFDISDADFNAGRFVFADNPANQGEGAGVVSNEGFITVGVDGRNPACCVIPNETGNGGSEFPELPPIGGGGEVVTADANSAGSGIAILAGRTVENSGSIEASNGQIALATGSSLAVSFDNGLISYEVTPRTMEAVNDLAAIRNSGQLIANGGAITLLARASGTTPAVGILNSGSIRANGISLDGNGGVYLTSTGGSIESTGTIDVSASDDPYDDGGESSLYTPQAIRIESDRSVVIGAVGQLIDDSFDGPATITANGPLVNADAGGVPSAGTILIQGADVTLNEASISGASQVRIVATAGDVSDESGSQVSGSAIGIGATGNVVLGGSYSSFINSEVPEVPGLEDALDPGSISIQGAAVALNGASADAASQFRVVATTGDITSSSSTEISGDSLDFQAAGDIELAGSFSAGPEVLTAVSKEGATGPGSVFIQGATVALNGAQIEATGPVYIAATSGDLDALSGSNDISGSALDLRATGSVKLSGSYQAAPIDGSGVLMTPNLDGSSSPGTVFIRGAEVVFDNAFIDGQGEVRVVATNGDVTDLGGLDDGDGPSNRIFGGALGIQASGSIDLGRSELRVGTGETLIGGDPSVGDRPGLIEQLRALYPSQQESVALLSPRADGIELDEVPDSPGGAPLYIPEHERPNASFVSGEDGSVLLGGQGGSLYVGGDYLYIQTNVYSFQLAAEPTLSISQVHTASSSSFPLFMQYVPASPGGSVGFEQNLGQGADLNLSPASFANFPGATLVFGSTANPGDVVIGDDGSVDEGTNGFNYVLAAGPGGLIYNSDGIETDGEVIVLGREATDGPRPPIDPPRIPDVLYPSPLPPRPTAEFIAARSEPVSNGAPDVTFDLAAALDSTIQYKSAAGPVLACQ